MAAPGSFFDSLPAAAPPTTLPRMQNWPGAILFDFDGVIVNSEPLHFRAFQQVLAEENIPITESEYYSELIGFDDRGAFTHLLQKHSRTIDPQIFNRLMNRKSQAMTDAIHNGHFEALPGAREFIRALQPHYPLAICSGALRGEIEAMLQGIGLRDCFPIIVAAEDVTVGKPDPQGYLQTVKLLAKKIGHPLEPADCLIVEDAPSVIQNVRQAGFAVLAVPTSHPPEDLQEANYIVPNLHIDEIKKQLPDLKLHV